MTAPATLEDKPASLAAQIKASLEALPSAGRLTAAESEAIYAVGHSALSRKRYDEAMKCFMTLLLYNPTHPVYLRGLALVMQHTQRLDAAIALYSFLGMIDAGDPAHTLSVAECQFARGEAAQARETLALVVQFCKENPGHAQVLTRAAALLDLTARTAGKKPGDPHDPA